MMPDRFRLAVSQGPLAGQSFAVEGELHLGRVEGEIVIADDEVSRRHAVIRAKDGGLEVEDLDSLNGTYVNDRRLEAITALRPGDVIRIGKTSIVVEVEREGGPTTTASAPSSHPTTAPVPPPEARVPAAPPLPPPAPPVPPPASTFAPPPARRRRRAATRSSLGVYLTFGVIVADALALVAYFATTG